MKTPGRKDKHSWDLDEHEISQIWTEVLEYVNDGEKLYLDAKLDIYAKEEQREAMESDEREGLVREYLEKLLPENWADMTLYERRNFLNGESEFGRDTREGTVRRKYVSNMEIWCECFEKDRANLSISESNKIKAILVKLGWVRQEKKLRIPLYGPQWIYVPG